MTTQTQTITMMESYKEAVNTQPGLEAVYPAYGTGSGYASSIRGAQAPIQIEPRMEKAYIAAQGAEVAAGKSKKKMVWLWVLVSVLGVVVVGLAAGLGVGLTRGDDSASAASNTDFDDSDLPNNATSTSTTSSSNDNNTESPVSNCPSANNTIVQAKTGSIRYRIHCDADFGGDGKLTLASTVLTSFDDCLALCNTMNWFQDRSDVGCTFNVAGTGQQTPGTCWCLGGTDVEVTSNVGNDMAIPISSR
ncbi:uncharacterized protein BDV14DRAFT_170258 [Aspergillus stella-maris]|uniref:uncharacterized protein n=1 Tax=Aspergillus stella-maris TaxID=1810926 RepID=UPI003CCD1276